LNISVDFNTLCPHNGHCNKQHIRSKNMSNTKKMTKTQQLKKQLKNSLHEEVTVDTHHYGTKTFTIGDFLDNQIVCARCQEEMPAWHKDQLVHPVMTALTKLAAEEERERKEAEAEAKKKEVA